MTSHDAIEELIREAFARLRQQEQRTAALEAAVFDGRPTVLAAPANPITQTPTERATDTAVVPPPRPRPTPAPRPTRPDVPASPVPAATVLDSLDDVVWSVSPDGLLVFFIAGAVEAVYGVTAHELTNHEGAWLDVVPGDDRERLRAALASLPDASTFALEHRVERPGGACRVVSRGKLVRDRDGRPLRVDGTTAARAIPSADEPARRLAALAAVGQTAAGVAHDCLNLLTVVAGNADLLRAALSADGPNRERAETIGRTAHTLAGLTRQLVALSRPGDAAITSFDASAAVRALEPLLRALTGTRVALAFDLAPELPLVRADPGQFDRVVLNLVLNARDATSATGRGGAVTVRTALVAIEPGRAGWPTDRPPGRYVALTVTDTGCGMPPEVKARVFEPFFTTKGERGTGLGLATVRDAVDAARGHIEVESAVGWGTTVRAYWPARVGSNLPLGGGGHIPGCSVGFQQPGQPAG